MYIILTDETNKEPSRDSNFFVYGGLFFPVDTLLKLDQEISKIRREAGYHTIDTFKFDTRSCPAHVSPEKAKIAKEKTIKTCINLGCKFVVHVISHKVIKEQDFKKYAVWSADYVIGRFNYFLDKIVNDYGMCIIDNLPQDIQYKYLSDKFLEGLKVQGRTVRLSRIKLFAATCIGAAHANSAVDIVLGSFRYCINNPTNITAAKSMISDVLALMWHERKGNTIYLDGKGLILRPKLESISGPLKKEYTNLIAHINSLIKDRS